MFFLYSQTVLFIWRLGVVESWEKYIMYVLYMSCTLFGVFFICPGPGSGYSTFWVCQLHCQLQDAFSGVSIDDVDQVIRNENTWRYIAVAADLSEEADHIGSWSEGCSCHGDLSAEYLKDQAAKRRKRRKQQPHGFLAATDDNGSCPFKGCRACELASGEAMDSLLSKMMSNRRKILPHVSSASDDQHTLLADWERARSRLWGDFVLNLELGEVFEVLIELRIVDLGHSSLWFVSGVSVIIIF